MNLYFVTCKVKEEIEVIKKLKPEYLLCSYWYFKNTDMKDFCENTLGYTPKIKLDSGAYSAFTKGKSISIVDYMKYIEKNNDYIYKYISLDVIGDPLLSKAFFDIMKLKGFNPIPVFHHGDSYELLDYYVNSGEKLIALGNTVSIRNKHIVADWCREMIERHKNVKYHLLGSCSKKILDTVDLYSCDSSTWYMMAVNGYPKSIKGKTKEAKVERAEYQMKKMMETG